MKLQIEPTDDFRSELRIHADDVRLAMEDVRDDVTRAAREVALQLGFVAIALLVVAVVVAGAANRKGAPV